MLDIGPLALFFAVNAALGIFAATGIFMVAVLIALAVSYGITRHLADDAAGHGRYRAGVRRR